MSKRGDTYDLFGGTPPHEKVETSLEAALAIKKHTTNLQRLVLAVIERNRFGSTDDEIEVILDMRHQTASARRRELVLKGLIEDSGMRRKTRSGRRAIVWRVKK